MRYEYKVVSVPTNKTVAERQVALNNQGTLGWELISIVVEGTNIIVYLKRLIAS